MPTWPSGLSFIASPNGFRRTGPIANVIRTPMDAGPVKTRRRFTAAPREISGETDLLTDAQVATFETFFTDDLEDGALSFEADDPVSGVEKTYRFMDTYEIIFLNDDINRIRMKLEIVP